MLTSRPIAVVLLEKHDDRAERFFADERDRIAFEYLTKQPGNVARKRKKQKGAFEARVRARFAKKGGATC